LLGTRRTGALKVQGNPTTGGTALEYAEVLAVAAMHLCSKTLPITPLTTAQAGLQKLQDAERMNSLSRDCRRLSLDPLPPVEPAVNLQKEALMHGALVKLAEVLLHTQL
jgi:hypothetical protein